MITRREFLKHTATVAGAGLAGTLPVRARDGKGLRVAAVVTEYRPWSHADVICGKFIQGFKLDVTPRWTPIPIHAMYVDQFPATDMSRALGRYYNFPIVDSIEKTILNEEGKLAVDGVLLIGEHGDYPHNDRGQHLYPRRRFFEETVRAFETAGEVVPVFTDKHLAPRWEDGKWMYETALKQRIPFMAGSSLPLTWRRPWLDVSIGTPMDEALSVGYGGIEAYGFHALETLQCMVERRAGGESGVKAVQCLEGRAVWEAMAEGRFSRDLLAATLKRNTPSVEGEFEKRCPNPAAFLIEYVDGFRAACLMLNGIANQFLFGARLTGDAGFATTQFYLQEPTFGHFDYLSNAIMEMVRTGRPPYPAERTALTTGILSTAMDSRFEQHRRIETPDMHIAYAPVDHRLGAYNHPHSAERGDGKWYALFNGRNLDGWRENRFRHEPRWTVEDGTLIGRGGQGYLATYETFEDFEFFAQVNIDDPSPHEGNSGIYFRCQPHLDRKQEFPPAYEAQCHHTRGRNHTGSIYALDFPGAQAPLTDLKDGEWFTLRIRARGNHLQTWVNGMPAANGKDPMTRFTKGYFLLQAHHETGVVKFRDVRVKRLA